MTNTIKTYMAQINHNRINGFELAAINKTIEVLEAYEVGKRVEYKPILMVGLNVIFLH